jgi:hypothetical protein
MFKFLPMAVAILAGVIHFGAQNPQDPAAQFRARFARETDPLHKAHLMPRFGDVEFQDAREAIEQDNLPKAAEILRQYRDQARSLAQVLDSKVADPEKHPSGFKQLQISVRESLRRISDIIHSLPGDEQKPFLEIRQDLDELDRHLVRELFPRQPAANPVPAGPKN